jgi:hypothetical protein
MPAGHTCQTVPEAGLAGKTNGELLRLAEGRFDVFLTLDKGLPFQQNLQNLTIAIVILRAKSNNIRDLIPFVPGCLEILQKIKPGQVVHINR